MPDIELDLATRIRAAVARTDRLLGRQVSGSGLTRTQFSVLGAVTRSGPLKLAALVDRERLHPTMLSRIVGALERDGLLRRVADPDDGRAVVLEVTDVGAELYQGLQRERTRLIEDYLAQLSPADRRRLEQATPLLEGLVEHLLAHDPSPAVPAARRRA